VFYECWRPEKHCQLRKGLVRLFLQISVQPKCQPDPTAIGKCRRKPPRGSDNSGPTSCLHYIPSSGALTEQNLTRAFVGLNKLPRSAKLAGFANFILAHHEAGRSHSGLNASFHLISFQTARCLSFRSPELTDEKRCATKTAYNCYQC
jgi:hypothetical protein